MKALFLKIVRFFQAVFFFILGLFFSFIPSLKDRKKETKKVTKSSSLKEVGNTKPEKTDETSSEEGKELFREYLKRSHDTSKDFESFFFSCIEAIYSVNVKNLSHLEMEKLQEYEEKVKQKAKNVSKEQVTSFIQKEIMQDKLKQEKENKEKKEEIFNSMKEKKEEMVLHDVPRYEMDDTPVFSFPLNQTIKSETLDFEKGTINEKEPVFIPEKTSKNSYISPILPDLLYPEESLAIPHSSNDLSVDSNLFSESKQESFLLENQNDLESSLEVSPILTEEKKELETISLEPLNFSSDKTYVDILDEKKDEEFIFTESMEHNAEKTSEVRLKEAGKKDVVSFQVEEFQKEKFIPEKDEIFHEEKKSLDVIDFDTLEKEKEEILKQADKEVQKEEFIDKDYEWIEELFDAKIQVLEHLLESSLKEEDKEKLIHEITKLKQEKKRFMNFKDEDLEKERFFLEEKISMEEIERFQKYTLEEWEFLVKHLQENVSNIHQNAETQIHEIEKKLLKDTLKKQLQVLNVPLFLSFPFIKNKYMKQFISGFFVFSGFHFLKNILFGSRQEEFDFSFLQVGSDALESSILLTEKNMESLNQLKQNIFIRYPNLKSDAELLMYFNQLQLKLSTTYQKLLKQEKMVQKYFRKSKVLTRKLEKRKGIL